MGMGDNLDLPDRNGVRTPMQWDDSPKAGFTTGTPYTEFVKGELDYHHVNVEKQLADKNSLFHANSKMIQVRKQHHAFGRGTMQWIETDNPAVVAYIRAYKDERLLIFHSLSSASQTVTLTTDGRKTAVDLLTGQSHS